MTTLAQKMMKELPQKAVQLLTFIVNAILRTHYCPKQLKTTEIILIHKPGKDLTKVESYRPISLTPIIAKLLKIFLMHRLKNDPNTVEWIPQHQFGFREQHSTVQKTHRVVHNINQALDRKEYSTSVFLDVKQAFNKVWHRGLLYNIQQNLPITYFKLMKSYINDREFRVRINQAVSTNYAIKSGVPQGSVLGPLFYLLYTADLPTDDNTTTGTFVDDTVILASHADPAQATRNLKHHLNLIQEWIHKWKIKMNEAKSTQVTFTLRREQCPSVRLNDHNIPVSKRQISRHPLGQ
jgi:hypothetical protein